MGLDGFPIEQANGGIYRKRDLADAASSQILRAMSGLEVLK
jgi:hypothetical protein